MDRTTPIIWRRTPSGIRMAATLLAATLAATGCSKKPEGPPAGAGGGAMPVSTVVVHASDVPLTGTWVGTLDGYVNAQIQPQVSGYLIKQNYREGSSVSKGQVLFQIDPRPFQAVLDQAEGQVGQAKAQLALTDINVKRDTPLAEARAIAHSQLDNEVQAQAQAKAAVASAEATVETAKLNLGFTQVRSLIGGVAGQATTQVGNLVGPASVLTSVSQLDPVKVYFSISDAEYLALTHRAGAGTTFLTAAAKIPLTLTLANGQAYAQKGHIVFIDRQLNAQTGAIRIAAAFPNPGSLLRPGQFGRISADTEVQHNVLLVPQIAVTELQGIQQVYTVTPDHKVHIVNVQLGSQHGTTDWIVTSGLASGTTVITDNLQKLREGAPVDPHPAPAGPLTSPVAR